MGNSGTKSARLRVLLIAVLAFSAIAAFLWFRNRRSSSGVSILVVRYPERGPVGLPEGSAPISTPPTPLAGATESPNANAPTPSSAGLDSSATPAESSQTANTVPENFVGTLKLIIPVVGVRPDQLTDTFADARSESRVHDAIDIPAPAGTAVIAAADGEVIKLFQSERGGTTIYQLSVDRKFVFYYAHLQRYADGLTVGKFVRQGETIAYVGDTGNAGAGNFHLHFSIAVINDPKRYWEGANINPYPLLHK